MWSVAKLGLEMAGSVLTGVTGHLAQSVPSHLQGEEGVRASCDDRRARE